MAFTDEEKDLVVQSLQFYLQQAGSQLPPQAAQQLMGMAREIVAKLDQPGAGDGPQTGEPPPGISPEWFGNVCKTCPSLTPGGCTDKITAKFPGKCDPILLYERNKSAA